MCKIFLTLKTEIICVHKYQNSVTSIHLISSSHFPLLRTTLLCWTSKAWLFLGVGLDDPQRSLPTPNILWFCDSCHQKIPKELRITCHTVQTGNPRPKALWPRALGQRKEKNSDLQSPRATLHPLWEPGGIHQEGWAPQPHTVAREGPCWVPPHSNMSYTFRLSLSSLFQLSTSILYACI